MGVWAVSSTFLYSCWEREGNKDEYDDSILETNKDKVQWSLLSFSVLFTLIMAFFSYLYIGCQKCICVCWTLLLFSACFYCFSSSYFCGSVLFSFHPLLWSHSSELDPNSLSVLLLYRTLKFPGGWVQTHHRNTYRIRYFSCQYPVFGFYLVTNINTGLRSTHNKIIVDYYRLLKLGVVGERCDVTVTVGEITFFFFFCTFHQESLRSSTRHSHRYMQPGLTEMKTSMCRCSLSCLYVSLFPQPPSLLCRLTPPRMCHPPCHVSQYTFPPTLPSIISMPPFNVNSHLSSVKTHPRDSITRGSGVTEPPLQSELQSWSCPVVTSVRTAATVAADCPF